jgi:uncharacterized protein YfbU (UPF0304 family)
MKLSSYERTVLVNQFRILQHLDKGSADHWKKAEDVFDNGYELEYGHYLIDREDDSLTEEQCREVLDIMDVFRTLANAKSEVKFDGFDGNHPYEGKLLGYLHFLWKTERYAESNHGDNDGGNSHGEMLPVYRRMVAAWKRDRKDIKAIEAAQYP